MGAASQEEKILKVSNSQNAAALASAISHGIYDGQEVILRAIGAGAVNQAVKAITIARTYVAARAIDLYCIPGWATVIGDNGEEISAIVFKVFPAR